MAALAVAAWAAPVLSQSPRDWTLEFGPYVGYFDFDRTTFFDDNPLFGARAALRVSRHVGIEAEFDEVYTRRKVTDDPARQISIALHGRYEPLSSAFSPAVMGGVGFVILDDSRAPDAFGEAFDLGLGLRYLLGSRWTVRGEWMLRRQSFLVSRPPGPDDDPIVEGQPVPLLPEGDDAMTLWGRGFRLGAFYAF